MCRTVSAWLETPSGSTSTLFIQNASGKRHLRLDYGWNKTTQSVNYHWNQEGAHKAFGITNHSQAGKAGEHLFKAAKYYRVAGRVFAVAGAAPDAYSIVVASNPLRRAAQVGAAWGIAWAACKGGGALGAMGGTAIEPGIGTAIGAVGGCVVGAFIGHDAGSEFGGHLCDWVEGTRFARINPSDEAVP